MHNQLLPLPNLHEQFSATHCITKQEKNKCGHILAGAANSSTFR